MIDRKNSRVERCPTAEAWELLREAKDILPIISARDRERQSMRLTAGRVIPQVVKLKARLDAYLGRPLDIEDITAAKVLECMAEIASIELNRHEDLSWSDYAITQIYTAERARHFDLFEITPESLTHQVA